MIPKCGFLLYQSYVNQYDLKSYLVQNNDTLYVETTKMDNIVKGLEEMLTTKQWTEKTTTFWKDWTMASHNDLEGYKFDPNTFLFCYQRIRVTACKGTLLHMLENKQKNNLIARSLKDETNVLMDKLK